MHFTLALIAAAATGAVAQSSIGSIVSPTAAAPSGCATSYASSFEITVVLPSSAKKRDVAKRDTCSTDGILVATLTDGVLTDSKGRIGSIVANHQFQFDGPPAQAGFIYDAGWSVCSNGSLALGGSTIFYQCLSGDFYNLYDEASGSECQEVLIDVIPCGSSSGAAETTDGQVTAAAATSAASQVTDGQVQASSAVTAAAASQITDGQIQASSAVTAAAATQISDGQIQASSAVTAAAVTQISDGQIQASSAVTAAAVSAVSAVSQISDGQVQAASALPAPVSQYTDGQIQVTASPAKVSAAAQITDGQIQVSKAAAAVTSSITTSYGAAVSQISDGQIQATAVSSAAGSGSATTAATAAAFTGAASSMTVMTPLMAGVAAVIALAM